jgi:aminotransferase EvaB
MSDDVPVPVFAFAPDPELDEALRDAAARVLASRRYVLGNEVTAFEREFAAFCGTRDCIGVANGTDALELALRAAGVGRGDAVATVANAGYYSCTALSAIGAQPVFVDVDETLTMSPSSLAAAMDDVSAVVVTHLYGRLAAIDSIVALADRYAVPVIEDCAQAHGAGKSGRRAGSFGAAGCFSFYPTKNLGALGDAGAVVTSDAALAERLRALRQYGWSTKYRIEHAGGRNTRLDELQAAFLRIKLPRLASWNDERRTIARRYCEGLRGLELALPEFENDEYVSHLFVIRARDRDGLRASLMRQGIETDVHYPIPDHAQPVGVRSSPFSLPVTEAACREVLTLPCFPGLAPDQVDRVIDAVREHYRRVRRID